MISEDILASIEMIRDSARGIASHGLGRIRKLRFTSPGFDRMIWAGMCSLGWLALRLPEDRGGVGLGLLEIELSRASIGQAALQWDTEGASSAALAAISRAKARASAAARKVTRDCIQLHGGIGFTDEHDIGLFLRKAMVEAPRFGGPAQHRARFGQLKPIEQEC